MLKLKGTWVAMITPFRNGDVDVPALRKLTRFLIANGVDGLVPCGTTGETPTLSEEEDRLVTRIVIDENNGRLPVLVGTGSNDTATAVASSRRAQKMGADAVLVVSPYYNKPTQAGLLAHFQAVSDAISIPLVVYNIASRTGVNIQTPTLVKIAETCRVAGVKEASGDIHQIADVCRALRHRLAVLSGDDAVTLPLMALGGTGVISVVGNVAPRALSQMVNTVLEKGAAAALPQHEKLLPLIRAMFVETSPVPVKTAASLLGLCRADVRLPLVPLAPASREALKKAMAAFGMRVR